MTSPHDRCRCKDQRSQHRAGTGVCDVPGCMCNRFDLVERVPVDPGDSAPGETGVNVGKRGKPRPMLVDPEFLLGMVGVMELGLQKDGRTPGCWKTIPREDAIADYANAMYRHALHQLEGIDVEAPNRSEIAVDPDDGADTLLHVATNAMILWWHLRNRPDSG